MDNHGQKLLSEKWNLYYPSPYERLFTKMKEKIGDFRTPCRTIEWKSDLGQTYVPVTHFGWTIQNPSK